jgi:phage terminase large subunit
MKTKKQIDINDLCHFTEKQELASRAVKDYKYVLYGGALGGGKSYFLRWKLIRMLLKFHSRGLKSVTVGLFCEDYPQLKMRQLSKVKSEFPAWLGDFNSTENTFTLKPRFGGGIIAFRNLEDASKYQSSEFAVIAIDELTRNTEETFYLLRTRLRWPGINDPRFIGATNPGGIGHQWVKKLWIDKVYPPNEQEKDQFIYIPALLKDNPYLIDESYVKSLESLSENKRKAFMDGNWDVFEGQYFSEWDREKHVVAPFEIPSTWLRFRSIDPSGKIGITSCHWYAVDHDGVVWVYKEYYCSGLDSDQHAISIRNMSEYEEYQYTIIDNSAFSEYGLPVTLAEVYIQNGVDVNVKSSKDRLTGWDLVHQYLRWNESTPPKLRIFSTCPNMIRTIPMLIHDDKKPEDVNTNGEDHAADELRYFLQTIREQKTPPPLNEAQRRMVEIHKAKRAMGIDVP